MLVSFSSIWFACQLDISSFCVFRKLLELQGRLDFFFFNDFVLRLTIKWSQICILTLFFLHKNQQNWLETECYFSGMTRPKNVSILFLFDISNEFYVKYLLSALVFKLCHMQSFTLLHLLHNRWRKMLLCIVF